ncbi:uncharacterized protein RCO7_14942 [Rhynchosporium graminicola]|uniref:Uncharacterized protein n=1 Tax=Rhynchosporium graminicola TaxID=2792576 RepID=A0A1E1LBI1_9HELO|nr:uncharacterized protein RCO7_14942 [Rhynchosporium commune]
MVCRANSKREYVRLLLSKATLFDLRLSGLDLLAWIFERAGSERMGGREAEENEESEKRT